MPTVGRDRAGGGRMVAGDQDRGDAGVPAGGDGGGRGGPGGSRMATRPSSPGRARVAGVVGTVVAVRLGDGEDPEAVGGELVGAVPRPGAAVRVRRGRPGRARFRRALQMIWYPAAGQPVCGGHPFAERCRRAPHPRGVVLSGPALTCEARFAAGGQQGGFGGIADGRPSRRCRAGWAQRSVVAQRRPPRGLRARRQPVRGGVKAGVQDSPVGCVPGPRKR